MNVRARCALIERRPWPFAPFICRYLFDFVGDLYAAANKDLVYASPIVTGLVPPITVTVIAPDGRGKSARIEVEAARGGCSDDCCAVIEGHAIDCRGVTGLAGGKLAVDHCAILPSGYIESDFVLIRPAICRVQILDS